MFDSWIDDGCDCRMCQAKREIRALWDSAEQNKSLTFEELSKIHDKIAHMLKIMIDMVSDSSLTALNHFLLTKLENLQNTYKQDHNNA